MEENPDKLDQNQLPKKYLCLSIWNKKISMKILQKLDRSNTLIHGLKKSSRDTWKSTNSYKEKDTDHISALIPLSDYFDIIRTILKKKSIYLSLLISWSQVPLERA